MRNWVEENNQQIIHITSYKKPFSFRRTLKDSKQLKWNFVEKYYVTKIDKIRKELKVRSANQIIEFVWHLVRIGEDGQLQKIWEAKPRKNSSGSPKGKWNIQVESTKREWWKMDLTQRDNKI